MAIGAIGNGSNIYAWQANTGSEDTTQLQRQKEILQKQLETVKSKSKNSQAEQDAAVKQKEIIQSKIAAIDREIQRLSTGQKEQQEESMPEDTNMNVRQAAQSPRQGAIVDVQAAQRSDEENALPVRWKTSGTLLDIYA